MIYQGKISLRLTLSGLVPRSQEAHRSFYKKTSFCGPWGLGEKFGVNFKCFLQSNFFWYVSSTVLTLFLGGEVKLCGIIFLQLFCSITKMYS